MHTHTLGTIDLYRQKYINEWRVFQEICRFVTRMVEINVLEKLV